MAKLTYTREQNLATLRSISFPFQKTPESYSTSYLARNASAVRRAEAEGREYSRKEARGHKEEGGKGKGKAQGFKATPNPATLKHIEKQKNTPNQWLVSGGKNSDQIKAGKALEGLSRISGSSVTVAIQGTFSARYGIGSDDPHEWIARRGSTDSLKSLLEQAQSGAISFSDAIATWAGGNDIIDVDAVSFMEAKGDGNA